MADRLSKDRVENYQDCQLHYQIGSNWGRCIIMGSPCSSVNHRILWTDKDESLSQDSAQLFLRNIAEQMIDNQMFIHTIDKSFWLQKAPFGETCVICNRTMSEGDAFNF